MFQGERQVLIIHRSKRQDMTFPKGKVDPGETLPETAIREVEEETKLRVSLGPKVETVHYELPNGKPKEVHYWSSEVTLDEAHRAIGLFRPNHEVDEFFWLSFAEARRLLTYPHDIQLLDTFIRVLMLSEGRHFPLIVLRHAKGRSRASWGPEEATRPLTPSGKRRAQQLVPILAAWSPTSIITSPWQRCADTVAPFCAEYGLTPEIAQPLTEHDTEEHPEVAKQCVIDLVQRKVPTVICSHRPVIPTILETIAAATDGVNTSEIKPFEELAPGAMVVIQLTYADVPQVISVETHSPRDAYKFTSDGADDDIELPEIVVP